LVPEEQGRAAIGLGSGLAAIDHRFRVPLQRGHNGNSVSGGFVDPICSLRVCLLIAGFREADIRR
jgi:hypothetical protein